MRLTKQLLDSDEVGDLAKVSVTAGAAQKSPRTRGFLRFTTGPELWIWR